MAISPRRQPAVLNIGTIDTLLGVSTMATAISGTMANLAMVTIVSKEAMVTLRMAAAMVAQVMAGAATDLDIYPTKSWDKDALVQPAPRKALASLLANGWTDALRDVFGDERV